MIGLDFTLRFETVTDINPSFSKARVAIAYAGRNRNYSSISREVFEEAVPSLFYCPVVGRYDQDTDDFGGHDIRVRTDKDGQVHIENATVPFGVVFGDTANVAWEPITEVDGTVRDYLCCDVILWKRQPGYERLAQQDTWSQSMEIGVEQYVIDGDGYCDIEKMYFEALCILGTTVEPCFESASVQLATDMAVSNYRKQFSLMLEELRQVPAFAELADGLQQRNKSEGGKKTLDFEENEVVSSPTESEDISPTEEAFENSEAEAKPEPEPAEDFAAESAESEDATVSFAATYKQKREALSAALPYTVQKDATGKVVTETYWWLIDFDDQYVYVEREIWTSSSHEDKKGRRSYTYDEATQTATVADSFEEMVVRWLTLEESQKLDSSRQAFEAMEQEFAEYKASHRTEDTAVAELEQFKADRLAQDHRSMVESVMAEFEDLKERAEFTALFKDIDQITMTAEELREKCYAIRGKYATCKFQAKPKANTVRIPVDQRSGGASRYGDLFEKYRG